MFKSIALQFEKILDLGSNPDDDVNRVRLSRQINGLNLFFVFVAGSISIIFALFMSDLKVLIGVQITAFFLYGFNILLNSRRWQRLASELTILVFEVHLFMVILYTGGLHSPAMTIIVLYPLLAALVEGSIVLHLGIGIAQFGVFYFFHKLLPGVESIRTFGQNASSAMDILVIMQNTYIPTMAAVIIGIIFKENLKAREKLKQMLAVITSSKKQLEFYSNELKDETQKLRAELNIAKHIQTMVLPTEEETRSIPSLDIACLMLPADEVGGDYYDIIKVGDHVMFGIGDVTGHGLSSGIIMLMAQTAIRTVAEYSDGDTAKLLNVLNRVMYSNIHKIKEEKSMTLALISYTDGHFSSAGQHESIVICRSDGRIEILDTTESGFYVGMVMDAPESAATVDFEMAKDDVLFLYSDGVTEAMNRQNEQFGLENIGLTLKKWHHLSAEGIKTRLIKDLINFIGEADIFDDISFMIIKQK